MKLNQYIAVKAMVALLCVLFVASAQAAIPATPTSSPSSTHYYPSVGQLFRIDFPRASNTIGYRVHRKLGSGAWKLVKHSQENFYYDKQSTPGVYYYRYTRFNVSGTSGASPSVKVTIGSLSNPTRAPSSSVGSASEVAQNFRISWSDAQNVGNYELVSHVDSTSRAATRLYWGPRNSKNLNHTHVANYYYKYKQCNQAGCSGYSPHRLVYVYGSPNGVANLRVSASSLALDESTTLTWNKPSGMAGDKGYYLIKEQSPSGATTTVGNIRSNFSNNKSFSVSPNNGAGDYQYSVYACNDSESAHSRCSSAQSVSVEVVGLPPSSPPEVNAGADMHYLESQSNRALTATVNDTDTPASQITLQWKQVGGPAVMNWVNKDKLTTGFKTPRSTSDEVLTFTLTATDNDGNTDEDTVKVFLNSRPTINFPALNGSVDTIDPVASEVRFASTASLIVDINNIADYSDNIWKADTAIRTASNNKIVYSARNMQLNSTKDAASHTYGVVRNLSLLQPNIKYRVTAKAIDDDANHTGYGWEKSQAFYVNDKPTIVGLVEALSVPQGEAFVLTTAMFNIQDSDDIAHDLELLSGDGYSVSGLSVTPTSDDDGELQVRVRVSDGLEHSEPFTFNVEMTIKEQANRQVIYIHTDLLGSPVAQTNEQEEAQ